MKRRLMPERRREREHIAPTVEVPQSGRVKPGLVMASLVGLLAFAMFQPLYGHGDEDHETGVFDSTTAGDPASGSLQSFAEALDSVCAEIAGTYQGIEPMLRRSCYDCHSDQTRYPWYHKLPIIRGMIDEDIREARKHLDMSEGFPFGGHASQLEQLRAIREEVEEGEMPLWSYRLLHSGTRIEGAQQDTLFRWIDSSLATLRQCYSAHGVPLPGESD